jgi:hypothetical protein
MPAQENEKKPGLRERFRRRRAQGKQREAERARRLRDTPGPGDRRRDTAATNTGFGGDGGPMGGAF